MPLKLPADADEVLVLTKSREDIDVLLKIVKEFSFISSTQVNWEKSEVPMVGEGMKSRLNCQVN